MAASHAIRILNAAATPEYDLRGINIDLSRKTGVLIRQSRKGADLDSRESRLRQEGLVPVAIQLRGDIDRSNIILYDEGSGVSGTKGYDQRPQLSRLYLDIANGVTGSIVVARVDRLFRDEHYRYVSMFTEIAEKQGIILIVPGRTHYDFTKAADLQSFQREVQAAYSFIHTQVQYMKDTRLQKVQRGLYGGGNLPAPYVIDKQMDKDQQVPVIYQPWQPIVVDLFQRFRDFDFGLARIARYIDEQSYIFPFPTAEDLQQYTFKTRMRRVSGGYTFSSADSIKNYFSNLALGGFAKIGKDAEGITLLLADAFEAALPMDLLSESYAAITGHYPDGAPCATKKHAVRSRNVPQDTSPAILHGLLASGDGSVSYYANNKKDRPMYQCHKGSTNAGWTVSNKVGIMRQQKVWSVPCEDLDRVVIQRLCELSRYDGNMSDRIKAFWDRRKSDEMDEFRLLNKQIERAQAQILRLDKLLTDPAASLSSEAERRYIQIRREAEVDRDRLLKKQAAHDPLRDPEDVIPNFYRVLAHLPSEYKRLTPEGQKRMARQVIQDIQLNQLSAHLFILRVTWQTGIATCPDVALVWRGMTPNNSEDWTDDEDNIMRSLYQSGSQVDLMRALPSRAWNRILERAQILGLRRAISHAGPHPFNAYHRTMRYSDLEAVEGLVDDPEQQAQIHQVVNTLATQTVRGSLSAHWWLPLDKISYTASIESQDAAPPPLLYVSALAYGSLHRDESPRR